MIDRNWNEYLESIGGSLYSFGWTKGKSLEVGEVDDLQLVPTAGCRAAPGCSLHPPCLCATQASHHGGPGLVQHWGGRKYAQSRDDVGPLGPAALRVVCQAELLADILASQLAVLTSH